jgi:hypothetical protein
MAEVKCEHPKDLAVTGLREILRDAWAITYRNWQSEDGWAA